MAIASKSKKIQVASVSCGVAEGSTCPPRLSSYCPCYKKQQSRVPVPRPPLRSAPRRTPMLARPTPPSLLLFFYTKFSFRPWSRQDHDGSCCLSNVQRRCVGVWYVGEGVRDTLAQTVVAGVPDPKVERGEIGNCSIPLQDLNCFPSVFAVGHSFASHTTAAV